MDIELVDRVLHVVIHTPVDDGMGAPVMFWGDPGVAKTARIKSLAMRYALPFESLSPGSRGEGAFGVIGMPIGTEQNARMQYPAPDWSDKFRDANGNSIDSLLFIDELPTAVPALQPALWGLVQERRIGSYYLGENTRVIAAGNPPEIGSGWSVAPQVANRMGHFDWPRLPHHTWHEYMMSKGYRGKNVKAKVGELKSDFVQTQSRIEKEWDANYAIVYGFVGSFTRARPELLYNRPESENPAASRAWPSYRSWDLATQVVTTAQILGYDRSVQDALFQGFLGEGVAAEVASFRANWDLPNPADLLDGKVQFKHDPRRADRTMAVFNSAAMFVSANSTADRDKRAVALWKLIEQNIETCLDSIQGAVPILNKANLSMSTEAVKAIQKMSPHLHASGMAGNTQAANAKR